MGLMKKYMVVGGSTGIGLEITKMLAEKGHSVVVLSRSVGGLAVGGRLAHEPFDAMAAPPSFPKLDGPLDGLAYCPGSINLKPFHRLKPEEFEQDFALNVTGWVRVLQQYLPNLKKSPQASVVAFSTVAVAQGMTFHASVAASKGAVESLARSLAAEWAPGIRVNVVAPSLTDTPLAEKLLNTDAKRQNSAERHPLKRVGTPRDLAEAAVFLLEPTSSWMTGQVLHVDGGMSSVRAL